MKTRSSYQTVLLLSSLVAHGLAQASCRFDEPEIGDIGPDGSRICAALERDFPNASIQVYARRIGSPTDVVITARVNGKPFLVKYTLQRADWIRSFGPCQARG
jgi:hypothetical protein